MRCRWHVIPGPVLEIASSTNRPLKFVMPEDAGIDDLQG
jgi:hypothetical protein